MGERPLISKRLFNVLSDSDQAVVSTFRDRISEILSVGDVFFFNYTQHGVPHVHAVLERAGMLIPDDTLEALGSRAICVLVMAIMAHDIGMFIHYSGLRGLLNAEKDWREKWDAYRRELRHMSDSDMLRIFGRFTCGDADPCALPEASEIIAWDVNQFALDWQKRLCGEFLRRHHHELAAYIVEKGFPIGIDTSADLFSGIDFGAADESYKNLIGAIAKSHGEPLDKYYKAQSALWDEDGISIETEEDMPVYYLMSVLRLADLMDAGEDRASWLYLQIQAIDAEISKTEFVWNRFVSISTSQMASEILMIKVKRKINNKGKNQPITSSIFQKIEDWIRYTQRELDICWRYITHFYNRLEGQKYRLSIRFIESNALDPKERENFSEGIVLKPAKLSASPDILGLLAEPLYGNHPTYGVRELLQNAVDACRERWAIEGESKNYRGKVAVRIDGDPQGKKTFTITDNGVGMTEDVILNYFLKAGSTYRNSAVWKDRFADKGVLRNGQFGIGVLAAFILGETVRVSTVPMGDTVGYRFTMRRGEYGSIDIERVRFDKDAALCDGGTRIEAEIDNPEDAWKLPDISDFSKPMFVLHGIWSDLEDNPNHLRYRLVSPFFWFWPNSLNNRTLPEAEYWLYGQRINAPIPLNQLSNWFEIKDVNGIKRMLWWPSSPDREVTCSWYNNIIVPEFIYQNPVWKGSVFPSFGLPQLLYVEDTTKECTINLERTKLRLPTNAEIELYIENVKLSLAKMIMEKKDGHITDLGLGMWNRPSEGTRLFSKHGYAQLNAYVMERMSEYTICVVSIGGSLPEWSDLSPSERGDIAWIFTRGHSLSIIELCSVLMHYADFRIETIHIKKEILEARIRAKDPEAASLRSCLVEDWEQFKAKNDLGKDEIRKLHYDGVFDNMRYRTGNYLAVAQDNDKYFSLFSKDSDCTVTTPVTPLIDEEAIHQVSECKIVGSEAWKSKLSEEQLSVQDRIMKIQEKYFEHDAGKDPWIPYDLQARKAKFPRFFDPNDEMYKYMQYVSSHYEDTEIYHTLAEFGIKEEAQ